MLMGQVPAFNEPQQLSGGDQNQQLMQYLQQLFGRQQQMQPMQTPGVGLAQPGIIQPPAQAQSPAGDQPSQAPPAGPAAPASDPAGAAPTFPTQAQPPSTDLHGAQQPTQAQPTQAMMPPMPVPPQPGVLQPSQSLGGVSGRSGTPYSFGNAPGGTDYRGLVQNARWFNGAG